MAASSSAFLGDPTVLKLAAGDRPPSWGLNMNLVSPPPAQLCDAYRALLETSSAEARVLLDAGAYFYPDWSLHLTLASPAPFTNTMLADADSQAAYADVWARALSEVSQTRKDGEWPAGPFPLVIERLLLDKAAGIMLYSDPTGAVTQLRDTIKRIAAEHPLFSGTAGSKANPVGAGTPSGGELLARSGFKVPGIIHSTVLRFKRDIAPGPEADAVRAAFDALAARWAPVTVQAEAVLLVHERVPYMHLHLEKPLADGGDSACIQQAFPFDAAG
jgi:hypothetical protein